MQKIKVLVATVEYPDNNGHVSMMYVHSRNVYYCKQGIDVTVLCFGTKDDYYIDGVKVISLNTYLSSDNKYNILICHAANLKNHYRFLKKHDREFRKLIFFFHGHEVLRINKAYCKPYKYKKKTIVRRFLQDRYDDVKLRIYKKYYLRVKEKAEFVFVSNWMLEEFLKWTKIPYREIRKQSSITYNCIGKAFEDAVYDYSGIKKYDFITIRNNLDGAKYCIDIVNEIAKNNPCFRFLVVGKGQFFNYYSKADNIDWLNQTMNHTEIIECLQQSRCALMPTRTDAQGLMMCEMASIGIPLITSDIPVCHEVFSEFENVLFIPNRPDANIGVLLEELEKSGPYGKITKYYNESTSKYEVDLIKRCIDDGCME